jgi:hypothetical protein
VTSAGATILLEAPTARILFYVYADRPHLDFSRLSIRGVDEDRTGRHHWPLRVVNDRRQDLQDGNRRNARYWRAYAAPAGRRPRSGT